MARSAEIAQHANFDRIRYAQCWEDASILRRALALPSGGTLLSVASAGDNALALLADDPARVIALDLNPAQLHCARLKEAALRHLSDEELLAFHGSTPGVSPVSIQEVLNRLHPKLPEATGQYWEHHRAALAGGLGAAGKFERYFRLFRSYLLPLAHSAKRINALLESRPPAERRTFYAKTWNSWRWRALFHFFFSRTVMGRMGRDPAFFRYVEGSVAARILTRTEHALTALDPSTNPYLHWILKGHHGATRPPWLEPVILSLIRQRIDRVEWNLGSLEELLDTLPDHSIDGFNLSDIFEYMSEEATARLLAQLARKGRPGARLVYWNMLAPRSRPPELADRLEPLDEEAHQLWSEDRAFFYQALRIEEVKAP